ncbi:MBL fold metallo-hydrolase [Parasphingorhabdus sp.]|uniref:MBL fold metallo-hydrolase n=1 Tax=Parasphingorhabdus sp. TaxID=2709688 RepID=UPI002F91F81A
MKKLGTGLLVLALLIVAAGVIFSEQIGKRLFISAVDIVATSDVIGDLPGGMHVVLCGTGSPLPDPKRAGPCSAVIVDGKMFIVDIGGGAVRKLGLMGLDIGASEALLLTHFHSDHIDGMGELMLQRWAGGGRTEPLPVIAPEGAEAVVEGLNTAYATDVGYRVAHHGEKTMPPSGAGGIARPFVMPEKGTGLVVYDREGIKITAFAVEHEPVSAAVGYRFDYKGRSVVFSGDTSKTAVLEKACNGCDILVHEVLNTEMVGIIQAAMKKAGRTGPEKIMADIPDYHASPVQAAETAQAGKAKMLVFTHIIPAVPVGYLKSYYLKDVDAVFDGKVVLGEDGMLFTLPANKDSIEQDQLL